MLSPEIMSLLRISHRINSIRIVNGFHTSQTFYLDQSWRAKRGLTENPNTFGPLTNLPDYSFKDGRPVPYGYRQFLRIKDQQNYAQRIVKLVGEIDHAVKRHARLQREKKEERQKILDSKLKPKGKLLLKKPNMV